MPHPKNISLFLATPADKPCVGISYIALQGLENAQGQFDRAARGVIRAASNPEDVVSLSQQAVELLAAKNQFTVSIRAAHVADEMQKTTLDLLA